MILIPWAGSLDEKQLSQLVAHEIGHMPMTSISSGLEHPRLGEDPIPDGFPLETLNLDRRRLMITEPGYDISGDPIADRINPETNEPYVYLIKEEWDKIHGITTPE